MKLIFKKSQLKSVLLFTIILIISAAVGFAMTIVLNSPTDGGWWTNTSSVDHGFTVYINATSETIDWCSIDSNRSASWATLANYTSGITNGTEFNRGIEWADTDSVYKLWNVTCHNGSQIFYSVNTFNLGVDSNAPTITLDSPSDNSYTNINTGLIKYTPTDASNPDTCDLYTNISGSWVINQSNASFVSGTQILYNSSFNVSGGNPFPTADGHYKWNAWCNDTAVNSVWGGSSNRTFTVDTTLPIEMEFSAPANNTVDSNVTPLIKWNQTTDVNFQKYVLKVSTNLTSFQAGVIQQVEITTITSNSTVLTTLPANDQYYIMVTAFDEADNSVNISTGFLWYAVDTIVPVVTANAPSNDTYTSDTTVDINVTVVDNNPDTCLLYITNITGVLSTLTLNSTETSITNGTEFNLTTSTLAEGDYRFIVECNDSDNNRVNSTTTPYDLIIDTTSPTDIRLNSTWHKSNGTDGTPILSWNLTTETNFERYYVEAINVTGGDINYKVNVTTKNITNVELDLNFSYRYNFSVAVYDKAGNTVNTSNGSDSWYYVDEICANLQAGWNLCGIVATTARNLSIIGADAGASYVSVWNATKEWKTCNVAVGTTNCGIDVAISQDAKDAQHVWIYKTTAGVWDNRTWSATAISGNITLNNVSTNGWTIAANFVRNGLTFEQLNDSSRFDVLNVSMYSKPYNNGTNNIPFLTITGYSSINKETRLEYGEAMWVFYNGTAASPGVVNSSHMYNTNGW